MRKLFLIISISILPITAGQKQTTLLFPPFKHTWGIHKGTEEKLDLILGDKTDFDNPQGLTCTRLKSWDDPKDDEDDAEVTAFGVNSGRGEIIYNSSMYSLAIYGKRGSGVGEMSNPHGICSTEDGNVYVADTGNRRIVHLYIKKDKLNWVKPLGADSLIEPFDVKVIPGDTLFISDAGRNSIVVMDSSGKFIAEFKKLFSPRGLDVDAPNFRWSAYKDNFIIVADSLGKRIVKLDRSTGKILTIVRMSQLGMIDADLMFVALDFLDNIYVTDSVRCQVHKFDRNLNYLTSVGQCGTDDEQFNHPRGIAIWRRFGQIVIAEKNSAQYYWVGVDVSNFKMDFDAAARKITVSLFVTEEAYIKAVLEGKDDFKLGSKRRIKAGKQELEFTIPNNIPAGKYDAVFTIEATYSSKGHFDKKFEREIKF